MNRYNCYEILNIDKNNIDKKKLRNAYYREALKYHPDKNTDDTTEKFQEINKSYEYLKNFHNFNGTNDTFSSTTANERNFTSTLHSFFNSNTMNNIHTTLLASIVEKIKEKCEDKAIDILKQFNYDMYKKIYKIIFKDKL